ncbi:glycoside hydrolase family 3 C-terminal domain-containing protein [bacterium]|nr:glycoside hydrolase family 3 C-terminal domain-containing protein [bacterium]
MDVNEKRATQLLERMTLDEKLAQIASYWVYELQTQGEMDWDKVAEKLGKGIGQITRPAGASTHTPEQAARTANRLQKFLVEETRLGIPAILHEECCLGTLTLGGTIYPQMLGLASSFRPELAEAMTSEIRTQMLAIGAKQGLAPVLDVARDPRWGRIEETFGEDPTLVSHFGAAYIRGLQSDDLAGGVAATAKHFVGHSLSERGLNCAPVHVGLRELHDIFMMPFQAAIRDAGLASVMNSYPELDGEVVAASRYYLTELLREKLGFEGLLVSDYEAISMLYDYHFVADTQTEAAALAMNAGIEVELPTTVCYDQPLKDALERGDVTLEMIDSAVHSHLMLKSRLGLFDDPYVDEGLVVEVFDTPQQRELAREIARQSMVLLKNDGLLPLKDDIRTLAVIGPNADSGRNLMGDYCYDAMSSLVHLQDPPDHGFSEETLAALEPDKVRMVTILEGIRDLAPEGMNVRYAKGCDVMGESRDGFDEAVALAKAADAVVLVLGDKSGLTPECSMGETRDSATLRLPGAQNELAEAVLAAGKPVAVVLVSGRPYAIPELAESADAILEAWLPGEEGGPAIAETLFGEANPGGKLPVTFPRSVGQLPLVYNAKPSGMKSNWYIDYTDESVEPLYPFGYGLSYTEFEYSDLTVGPERATAGETISVTLKLRNSGEVAGDEVVQLYTHQITAGSPRPMRELRGYRRVTLAPGESCRVTFYLPVDQLAFYDRSLRLHLESGEVEALVGSSSEDIRLSKIFEITGEGDLPVADRVIDCPVSVDKLDYG